MTKLTDLSLTDALSGLDAKDFTSVELTQAYLDSMSAGKALNAYTTETPDKALDMAAAADAARADGSAGALAGIEHARRDLRLCATECRVRH